METYSNLNGKSGIRSYEIGLDSIKIMFTSGSVYLYDYAVTGIEKVEHMKELALEGIGLNKYISQVIKKTYALRLI